MIFIVLGTFLALFVAGFLLAPERFRSKLASASYATLGALLGLSPAEIGIYGLVLAVATLLGLFIAQADSLTRLTRIGAYLVGGGIGGLVLLLSLIVRIRNVCSTNGAVTTVSGTGSGSYECYSVETIWALIPYGAVACLGALMLFLAWRRRTQPAERIGPTAH